MDKHDYKCLMCKKTPTNPLYQVIFPVRMRRIDGSYGTGLMIDLCDQCYTEIKNFKEGEGNG